MTLHLEYIVGVMRRRFSAKFFVICLAMLGFLLILKSAAIEYEGDGTYVLRPGDRIRTSNGYIVELALAWGEMGSRSDWRTDIIIYDPSGKEVAYKIFFGNYTFETSTLCISIERYIENEAVITVSSKLPGVIRKIMPISRYKRFIEFY